MKPLRNCLHCLLLAFLCLFYIDANAQTPQFYNSSGGTSYNAFPLNTTTNLKVQWIYGPNYFNSTGQTGTPAYAGLITKVYFRIGTSVNPTFNYADYTISLGQNVGTQSTWTGTTFVTGLAQCFYQSSFQMTGAAATSWFGVTLQTPFLYDPSMSLVFELKSNSQNGGNQVAQVTTTGSKRLYGAVAATTGTSNTGELDFGFDLVPAGPCTSPPTAGTATANPTSGLCAGSNIQLNLTGYSTGSGQTYQWESSPFPGGPFTPISGATNPAVNIPATTTQYYRCAVTCSFNTQYSTDVLVNVNPAFAAGTYTINSAVPTGSGNFQTFGDAVNAISCGISGPIVFNVVPGSGPYNEQINLPATIGANATNTVTFNGNGCVLTRTLTTTGTNYATVNLDGADYITFDSLTIEALGTAYGFGVHLMNAADNNTFNKCTINANIGATATTSACVSMSGSPIVYSTAGNNGSNNTFSNCTLNGGYFGCSFYGISGGQNTNNKVVNCTIRDFYVYGIYGYYQNSPIFSGNNIERPLRTTVSTFYGMFMTTGCTNLLIEKNRIRNPFGGIVSPGTTTAYGLYFSVSGTAGNYHQVINNQISDFNNNNGTQAGIWVDYYDYFKIYHNTISLDNTASTAGASYGIFCPGSFPIGVDVRDNLVSITRGGSGAKYGLYLMNYQPGINVISNNNNIYVAGGTGTKYWGYDDWNAIGYTTQAAWTTASGNTWDVNSFSYDPVFASPSTGNYSPTYVWLDNVGAPLGITDDINNAPRSMTSPDIGAYEFVSPTLCTTPPAAGTLSPVLPTSVYCNGSTVNLKLTGNTIGSGQTYQVESSTSATGPFSPVGAPQISYFISFTATSTQYYRVAVTCGANTDYSNALLITVPVALSGTFTINSAQPSGGTNFNSFADATAAINCGIAGPIIFNIAPGTYNEIVTVNNINGASATNTITFNAAPGAILSSVSTNSNERGIFKLNGSKYVTINGLTINAFSTSTSQYGIGVLLTNDADSNTISNCTIVLDSNTTSTNYVGIALTGAASSPTSTGSNCDGNIISGNTVSGGYYGMTLFGAAAPALINNNQVINNVFKNFYAYGVYASYTNNTLLEGNDISRPNRTTVTTFAGFYLPNAHSSLMVSKNKVHNAFTMVPTNTSTSYGIAYITASVPGTGSENTFSNNILYNMEGNGTHYGFYNSASGNIRYYHNTINFDYPTSTGTRYGLYQTGLPSGSVPVSFMNNIVYMSAGATKYGQYRATATTVFNSNYNDFYITGSGTNYIGYAAANQSTLAAWQTATSGDANSVSLDPSFVSPGNGMLIPINLAVDNLGTPAGITTDITNAARSTTTPDIGAYEFTATNCSAPPTAGTISGPSGTICSGAPFSLNLSGYTIAAGITFQWESSPAGVNLWTPIAGATTAFYNTTSGVLANSDYRVVVTCTNSSQSSTSNTFTIILPTPLAAGTYTINGALPTGGTNFQTFADVLSTLNCSGISGPVVFNVSAGLYNEQITIGMVGGASSTNTVTFNGNGATIDYLSGNSAERGIIKLNGSKFITINNFVINSYSTSTSQYAFSVLLTNDADSNVISNNTIILDSNTTSTNYYGIVLSGSSSSATTTGSNCDGNIISGNTIIGGYNGITLNGIAATPISNNQVLNNVLRDYYQYGIYVQLTNNTLVQGNDMSRPTRTSLTTFSGVFVTGLSSSLVVNANKVHDAYNAAPTNTGTSYGIIYNSSGTPAVGNEIIVSNNILYNMAGHGTHYGCYNTTSGNIRYYHNTIVSDYTAATAGAFYGFYQTGTATGIEYKNNIIYVTRGGTGNKFGIYKATAANVIVSNNNDFYINSANTATNFVGFQSANQVTLTNWQTTTSQDANSVSIDPLFLSAPIGNLFPTNSLFDNLGTPVGITTDITSATRSTTTPDIGAYEFSIPPCVGFPTAGTASVSSGMICQSAPFDLNLSGFTIAQGITIQWESSPAGLNFWSPISGATTAFYTVSGGINTSTDFRAVVTCTNGNLSDISNTVSAILPTALPAGTYTINGAQPTGGTNFQTFADVIAVLNCAGIAGPVIFNVAPGTYNEQVLFGAIGGASAINTVTFNGNGATLAYVSSNTNERGIIKLNGTKYLTIDSLVINAYSTSTTQYAIGVLLTNDADSNTIRNCTIILDSNTTSTNYVPIAFSGAASSPTTLGSNCDGNTISGNTLIGGYYGMVVFGNTAPALINDNVIINNVLRNFYAYGIYAQYTNNTLMEGNDISRPNRTTVTTFAGFYLPNAHSSLMVSKNKVHNAFTGITTSTGTSYGIAYITASAPGIGSENTFSNNILYNMEGNGTHYGFYNSASGNLRYYHNTINFDYATTTGTRYGIYQTGLPAGSVPVEIKNNIIYMSAGAAKYGQYRATATTVFVSDYNDFYITGSGTNYIGYAAAAQSTLAAWQTASGGDANSVTLDPMFVGPTTGNLTFGNSNLDNLGTFVGILDDINNVQRSSATPDMGAFEIPLPPCTSPPTPGIASATPNSGICGGANITLNLTGQSTGSGQTYQWEESFLPGGPFSPAATAGTIAFQTISATTSKYYRCAVTCGASTTYSTEVFVSVGAIGGNASVPSDTICYGGSAGLSLSGYSGDNIQWEAYDSGTSSWLPISGATTSSYSVANIQANTSYRAAVSCSSPTGTVYSDTINMVVLNPSIVNVFPGARCDAGPVTLAAEGASGTTVKWYDAITAGNLLGTGNAFTSPTILSTTTYYAAAATGGGSAGTVPLPAHGSNFSGNVRGMWFTAPVSFTITGLKSLAQTTGNQSIAVVKFNAPPPIFSATTNAFTVLHLTQNNPSTAAIPVNIQINAGDHIGILSQIGTNTSYATPTGPFVSTIGGQPVTIKRIGMQFQLGSTAPQDLWEETNGAIGRTEITYQIGCEGSRVPVTATITGLSSGTGLSTGGTTILSNQTDGTTVNYDDGCNDKVATVVDAVGGNVLGNTYAVAVTTPTVQTFNNKPYVPRIFDITPTSNGPATVTLYALQSEFNAYNSYVTANSLSLPLLPAGPTDPNVSNIVITQFHGAALAASTGPLGLYDGQNSTFITNSNIAVAWTGNYWTMTFPVTGFSGFFIHSGSTPLLIDLVEISAANVGKRNRIDWSTANEHRGDVFELQRSADGNNFTKLTEINAKGEASSYTYWDENPISGVNHYRLKMVDATGNFSYSKVVTATVRVNGGFVVEAYPNPVSDVLTVQVYGATGNNATVTIADVTGKVIRMISVEDNQAQINMSDLAQGVYLVKYADSKQSQTIKVNKQ